MGLRVRILGGRALGALGLRALKAQGGGKGSGDQGVGFRALWSGVWESVWTCFPDVLQVTEPYHTVAPRSSIVPGDQTPA